MRPLHALVLGLALLSPALAHAQTTVIVRDEAGAPVSGAQVYVNCAYQGSTDAAGARRVLGMVAGDHLQARKLVQTGPTAKAGHDGWSYHAWITNIAMENDGSQTDDTVLDPAATQTIVVRRQNAQIGWNLVTTVEYNGTAANLDDVALGLQRASEYLFDVTDGQFFFEQATVYEDGQSWADADFQYSVTAWPSAYVGGPAGMADARLHTYLAGPGFYGPWSEPIAFRAIGHEAGHYGLALGDEYHYEPDGLNIECTAGRASDPETHRASIMAYPYDATELCHDGNHNPESGHGRATGRSTWASTAATWSIGPWSLRTPMTRGAVNPGPESLSCFSRLAPRIVPAPTEACEPLRLRARDSRTDEPIIQAPVDLHHRGRAIYEGNTSDAGELVIYGAEPGDHVSLRPQMLGSRCLCWGGSQDVTSSCGEIDLTAGCVCFQQVIDRPFWRVRWHHEGDPPEIGIQIPAHDPGRPVQVLMEQDGLGARKVQVAYDGKQQAFVGSFPFDAGRAPRFALQLSLPGPDGKPIETSARLEAARYPSEGASGELFPVDGDLSLHVEGAALPDGTAVLASDTLFPQAPPQGLVARHGAVTLDAEAPLAKPVTLGLRYRTDGKSFVDAASIQIHRLDGETWVPIPTVVDAQTQRATAQIDRWGTYAVFGRAAF